MGQIRQGLTSLFILLALTLSGCGGGSKAEQQATPTGKTPGSTLNMEQASQSQSDAHHAGTTVPAPTFTSIASPSPSPLDLQTPVPTTPAKETKKRTEIKVKGIYVSAWNMQGPGFERLFQLVKKTDLNAMVIDVKNDSGQVTYSSSVPLVKEIHADSRNIIPNIQEKLKQLKNNQIYTIARIVVFKDPYLAGSKPEYAMQKREGGIWRDPKGVSWVDPYNETVWEYNVSLAAEAASLGFDEIQFDYVRFPDNGKKVDQQVRFQNAKGYSKSEAIQAFLKRAKERLGQTPISADVFGLTTSSKDDMGIGQKWEGIAPIVDVICPMIYPSHYSKGMYNIPNPDTKPYQVVSKALQDAAAKNKTIGETSVAQIRPWYQDFTAKWVKPHLNYGNKEVQEQIRAGKEKGIEEFLLWNPSGRYSYR